MWPWQQKKDKARILLLSKLAAVCLSGHLVFLFCLFFVYQDSSLDLALTISKTNATNSMIDVIWVKQTAASQKKKVIAKKNNTSVSNKKTKQKKQASPVLNKPKAKKETQKKSVKTELKKVSENNKPQTVQMQKKVIKKPEQKSVPVKPVASKKEVNTQRQDQKKKKETQKKRKREQQKKIKQQKELAKQKRLQESIDAQASLEELKQLQAQLKDQPIEVVHSYKEVAQLRQFLALQEEIAHHWKPPVGIAPESSCEVKITVDWECHVAHMEMLKSSGILMYDIAARAALQTMEMPKWIRGKSITITFKQ